MKIQPTLRFAIAFVAVHFMVSALAVAPLNVIFFVGDGMGPEHVEAGRYFANGDTQPLFMETLTYTGTMTHNNASGSLTDSAAAGTAMATGQRVNNGVISVALPGNGSELPTVLEIFQTQGRRTGLVTIDTPITDATPAAFGAHANNRGEAANIAGDFFNQTRPNVLFGEPGSAVTPTLAMNAGYNVVTSGAGLAGLNTATTEFVSGQFNFGAVGAPSLADMTTTALDILANDPDGFFLLVEHEDTDTGAHANDISRVVNGVIELNAAVQAAFNWATTNGVLGDTLIIVTADHETGGLNTIANNGAGVLPTVSWTTGGHTTTSVPVYATGPMADASRVSGQINNTDIFYILTGTTKPPPFLGNVTPNISTGFQEAALGSTSFSRGVGDTELAWEQVNVSGGGYAEVRDMIDDPSGGPITGQQFVVHNRTTELVSEQIDVSGHKQVQVSIDVRAFQTSTAFESSDDIDLSILVSEDGESFSEVFFFQSEGANSDNTGKGEIEAAGFVGTLDGGFITITSPVGRIADNIQSIRVVIDADNNSSSERFIFDNVHVTGLLRTGREEVFASTSFEEPSLGAREHVGTGGELGFTRQIDANGDGTFGDEDTGGVYGVTSTFSGVTNASDGFQAYESTGSSGGQGVQQLLFDAVDLTGHEQVMVSVDVSVLSADWEAQDFLRLVLLADDGTNVDELVIFDTTGRDLDQIGEIAEGEAAAWETFGIAVGDQYLSAVLQITTSSNSSVLAERFYLDNVQFSGSRVIPEPSTVVLLVGMSILIAINKKRRR